MGMWRMFCSEWRDEGLVLVVYGDTFFGGILIFFRNLFMAEI